jgi:hypothetical protein
MRKIKNILRLIRNFIVKYYLKAIAPIQILWVRYKHYDLHHVQLWYFWPKSNFIEVNQNLEDRIKELKQR